MYCLDTNVIVDVLRGDEKLKEKFEMASNDYKLFITPITLCELFRGAFGHAKAEDKIRILELFISNFYLLEFDISACKEFGRFCLNLKNIGRKVNEFDLMIASIVKVNNLILITRDKKHFENIGIKVEVW